MGNPEIYLVAAAAILGVGLHGIATRAGALRKLIAANVIGAGVFMVLVAIAARGGEGEIDPVPHAMVLTGIVIAVGFTAFGAVLAVRLERTEDEESGEDGAGGDGDGAGGERA